MPRRRYAGREGQAPEGLRSLRSLRPLPSSSASSLRDNLLPKGPSPCPCPGVDTPSGAWPPRPAPHDGNHPSGSKRGDGNLSDECRCGGRVLRMNVYAAGCCCGGEIVLRPNHRMRRGQGATPAAFYLGLCRLRGILSPPASSTVILQAGQSLLLQRRELESDADRRRRHYKRCCRRAILLCGDKY